MIKEVDYNIFCEISKNLLDQKWIFAKTMPQNPHWYTLRKDWGNDKKFNRTVDLIRQYGYNEKYKRSWYTMFNINNIKYWTMGAAIDKTILINRANLTTRRQYDDIADIYDGLFVSIDDIRENEKIISMLPTKKSDVLDIGCGTGLLLDYLQLGRYTGIDPSAKMLHVLRAKHPLLNGNIVNTEFESFFSEDKYDLIVSLFGAASYIQPWSLSRIINMLQPNGKYFIMFYKPGYLPLTYSRANVRFTYFQDGYKELPGEKIAFGNYLIIRGSK